MGRDAAPVAPARSAPAGPSVDECLAMGMTCACYNLRRASRAVTQVFDSFFEDVGLKATQFTVLAALLYESEGRPTVSDLANALVLDQSSLSRNLAVLERQGLIRLVAGEDKRERIVTLTRAGRVALTRGYPSWKQAQNAIAEALDPKELETQLRALRRLTKVAQAMRPGKTGPRALAGKIARKSAARVP
ncbi:MAG: Transcriptional regulator, MarR family [Labilithrix sp.]|nr:Transcriptional regulator, MarR family [Labilithrix sp.]